MKKIITGFKAKQDVRDTLQWIEDNTEFKWHTGENPTEFTRWAEKFDVNQNN